MARQGERQRGLVTRRQALRAGLSKAQVDRLVVGGKWQVLFPCVYGLPGAPRSWEQSLMGACLWADAVASHRSAAALWSLEGFAPGAIEISSCRRVRARPGVVIHRAQTHPRVDLTRRSSIPVTTPARTLFDLGAVSNAEALEVALEDALRRGLVSLRTLHRTLERLGAHGRRGTATLRRLLQERSDGPPPESLLEIRLLRLLARAGLPEPVRQWRVRENGRVVTRIDLAYPQARIAIEADGYRYHSGLADWRRDRRAQNLLTVRGWRVLRVTWDDVATRPRRVVAEIARLLQPSEAHEQR